MGENVKSKSNVRANFNCQWMMNNERVLSSDLPIYDYNVTYYTHTYRRPEPVEFIVSDKVTGRDWCNCVRVFAVGNGFLSRLFLMSVRRAVSRSDKIAGRLPKQIRHSTPGLASGVMGIFPFFAKTFPIQR